MSTAQVLTLPRPVVVPTCEQAVPHPGVQRDVEAVLVGVALRRRAVAALRACRKSIAASSVRHVDGDRIAAAIGQPRISGAVSVYVSYPVDVPRSG